jgi:hypothetical protein
LRKGTKVERFPNVQRDGLWIRVISRLGVAFVNEPGVVRLLLSPVAYTLSLGGASSGDFTLSLNGKASANIAYDAIASAVKTAIVAIDDGVAASDVTVTGSAGSFTVSVPGTLTVNGAGLSGGTGASVVVA